MNGSEPALRAARAGFGLFRVGTRAAYVLHAKLRSRFGRRAWIFFSGDRRPREPEISPFKLIFRREIAPDFGFSRKLQCLQGILGNRTSRLDRCVSDN